MTIEEKLEILRSAKANHKKLMEIFKELDVDSEHKNEILCDQEDHMRHVIRARQRLNMELHEENEHRT